MSSAPAAVPTPATGQRPAPSAGAARAEPALRALFAPGSVAVVGASPDLAKPGGRALAYLSQVGYRGRVYPVNPRHEEIGGLRAYASVEALPEAPDLAIFIIPAGAIPAAVAAAGARGVRSAVVCSSGFAEAGAAGRELERQLVAAAEASGMALLGPNCLGYFDARHGIAATFSTALQLDADAPAGQIAFVSQSGALGAGIFSVGRLQGAGLGMFVSTGNEALVGVADVVRYLAGDDDVSTVLCYIEGTPDGRGFVDAARLAREAGKRVAAIKVGRTDAGVRASQSHTGALAGSSELWDAAFRRAGVLMAEDMQHLLDIGVALDGCAVAAGRRIAVVSMSGGAAALMADRAAQAGLELPLLSEGTRARLAEVLPGFAGTANPVDYGAVYGDPGAIERVVRIAAGADEIDIVALFIGLTPGYVGVLEEHLARIAAEIGKPLLVAWLGAPRECLGELRARGVPAYDDPSRMIDAAAALARAPAPLPANLPVPGSKGSSVRAELERMAAGVASVPERELKALLARAGLPVVREERAATAEQATALAGELGSRVAVKVDAEGLLHKSDIGGVVLGVGPAAVEQAFAQVTAAGARAGYKVNGALVAQMAEPGLELIVGGRWDAQFGPTVLVGAGGVTAEVLGDVRVELAPVTAGQAREMLGALRTAPLLSGYRGEPARDLDAAAEVVAGVSRLVAEAGGLLAEFDLNPLVVYPEGAGCLILDAAAVLARP
jgi:acetate---CoA ligase (ADP-forming)